MLEKISWGQYVLVVVVVVVIYYAIVFLLLYRAGLISKPSLKSPSFKRTNPQKPASKATALPTQKAVTQLGDQHMIEVRMNSLIDGLLQYLQDISNRSYIKEEIIMGLQIILRDYKEFSGTVYQGDISDYIKKETENYCSVELTEEEILSIWIG